MQTVLITGGSRGIGAETVRRFTRAGWCAAFLYRSSAEAARVIAEETGAIALCCDLADPAEVKAAVREAENRLGHIDALVNNAGTALQKLLPETTDAEWDALIGCDLSGVFRLCREVLPGMIARKHGAIVNIGSIWGQVGASCEAAYSAAKAGVIGLTKALAKEVGPSGVTVNCVCPGVIATDMLAAFSQDDLDALREETPLGRLGTPADVAECVWWLCSGAADFITGQVIGVNGGFGE